ncbi:Zinc finger MYM-type protein 1 [Biomphalaria glabrata]|nr:Zinc finger MYM-type protein 1 [Biomphalaria glabrata]
MLDSTPDLAHREQLSEVIRFVDVNFKTKKVTIKESFLGFIQLHAKDAATLENVIVEQLQADNLPIADCRSQCYDNAAVMAGELSGLQQRIAIRNPQASFVNCNNHSLNLAGLHAAKQDPVVVTFFGTVEKMYVFFSASTVRWKKMKELLGITLKRECPTRWSARQDAVNSIHEQFDGFLQLLENLYDDGTQTSETQNDAYSLLQNVMNFNFITLLDFWHAVLSKIDRIQKRLQDPSMNFHDAALDLEGLQQRLSSIMKSVIDRLIQEMTTRFGRLKTLDEKFGFLFNISKLFANDTSNDIQQHCATLADFYKTDIDGTELKSVTAVCC